MVRLVGDAGEVARRGEEERGEEMEGRWLWVHGMLLVASNAVEKIGVWARENMIY